MITMKPMKLSKENGVWVIRDSLSQILLMTASPSQNLICGEAVQCKHYEKGKRLPDFLELTVTSLSETQTLEDSETSGIFMAHKAVPLLYYDNRYLACFGT